MIVKDHDQIQLSCDDCGNETPVYDDDQFEQMISAAKSDGWTITRPSGTWEHRCSDCALEDNALAAARRKFGIG